MLMRMVRRGVRSWLYEVDGFLVGLYGLVVWVWVLNAAVVQFCC